MIDVFVVAAVRLYREGLTQALGERNGIRIAGSAAEPCEVAVAIAAHPGAVLVLDVAGGDGAAPLADVLLANPGLRVVVLGVSERPPDILLCAEAGASGYVTRDGSLADLVLAIESVARDELTCPPEIAGALIHRVATLAAAHRHEAVSGRLSRREIEIVGLIDRGLTNKEIAGRLFIALATVKNHVHNILDKLDVQGRDEAAAWIRHQRLGGPARAGYGAGATAPLRDDAAVEA